MGKIYDTTQIKEAASELMRLIKNLDMKDYTDGCSIYYNHFTKSIWVGTINESIEQNVSEDSGWIIVVGTTVEAEKDAKKYKEMIQISQKTIMSDINGVLNHCEKRF